MLITYSLRPAAVLGDKLAATVGLCAWIISAVLYLPTVRLYRAPLWTAFLPPCHRTFYLIATVESAIRYWTGRGGLWKGRVQDA